MCIPLYSVVFPEYNGIQWNTLKIPNREYIFPEYSGIHRIRETPYKTEKKWEYDGIHQEYTIPNMYSLEYMYSREYIRIHENTPEYTLYYCILGREYTHFG